MIGLEKFVQYLVEQKIKFIEFDCDGVLTSSSGLWHGEVISETLSEIGEWVSVSDCLAAYTGPGHGVDYFRLLFQNLFKPRFKSRAEEVAKKYRSALASVTESIMKGDWKLEVEPLPGVRELLSRLSWHGIKSMVVTMTPTKLAGSFLTAAGVRDLVGEIVGCDVFSPFPKVDPKNLAPSAFAEDVVGLKKNQGALWQKCAKYFGGVEPIECFGAEDGEQGTQGLLECGVKVISLLKSKCVKLVPKGTKNVFVSKQDHDWSSFDEL